MPMSPFARQLIEVAQIIPDVTGKVEDLGEAAGDVAIGDGSGRADQGFGSIGAFLGRLNGPSAGADRTKGGGTGEGRIAAEAAASQTEVSLMAALQEPLEYVRLLIAAAKWARIPEFVAIRAPKSERDALIAAYEEAMAENQRGGSGTGGATRGGGGHIRDPIITTGGQAIGGQNFTNNGGLNVAIGGASVAAARQEGLLRTVADEIRGLRSDLRVDGLSSRTSGA